MCCYVQRSNSGQVIRYDESVKPKTNTLKKGGRQLKQFNRIQKLILLLFLIAFSFTAVRVVRTASNLVYWHSHRDEPISNWMTLHSYHVPPHVLYQALDLPHRRPDKRSLKTLSKLLTIPLDAIQTKLDKAIIHSRLPYPPPVPERAAAL